MKQLVLGLLSLTVAMTTAMASNGETRDILFTGSNSTEMLSLRGEETHTEYRTETRTNTCYRTEIAGYRTVCSGGYGGGYGYPNPGPRPFPGGGPRPFPGGGYPGPGYCSQQPVYRTVAYTCYETVQIPYEVHDYDTVANITVNFGGIPAGIIPRENVKIALNGSNLTISAKGSKSLILELAQQNVNVRVNGNVKMIDANYNIALTDASLVLKALNSMNASIDNNILTYDLGAMNPAFKLVHSLKLLKLRVGADTVLFDRNLSESELAVTARGERTEFAVDFKQIGSELIKGKFSVNIKSAYAAKGPILNAPDFGEDLVNEKTIIYKIR